MIANGFAIDRDQAARLLMAGHVRVGAGDGARTNRKPGELIDETTRIELVERPRFVSRGGEKLDAALDEFGVHVEGRICLDVGASTGGFTDALLGRGATRVYALDVGRGQLAESLRNDARVVSLERTHAARLDPASTDHLTLPEAVSLAVIDVSFISLTRVLRGVVYALSGEGEIVALVKPQFEVAAADVPGGVVRDDGVRLSAVSKVLEYATSIGLSVRGQMQSPLRGPAGNIEYLVHLVR